MTLVALSAHSLAQRRRAPFASVACFADPTQTRAASLELEAAGGAYQTLRFAEIWREAFRARVAIVVARDDGGQPVALLALRLRRFGPLTVAGFVGDALANCHMGLFRAGRVWRADEVRALPAGGGRAARIDLFAFFNQPARWAGADNPLRLLPSRASPTSAFASTLSGDAKNLDAHFSRATQKKLRKKARKLEAFGALAHQRARDAQEAARFLDALFLTSQPARAARRTRSPANACARCCAASSQGGLMEMHALSAGERIVAVLGALPHGRRLSGLVVSYDPEREIAAATPGELLLIEVVRDAFARGFRRSTSASARAATRATSARSRSRSPIPLSA